MQYQANWERACLANVLTSAALVALHVVSPDVGQTFLVGVLAFVIFVGWLLFAAITLGHSASSLAVRDENVIHLSFGRAVRSVPLAELVELEVLRALYPGVLRFRDGTEMHVSGIAIGRENGFAKFLKENAPSVAIKESLVD